MKLDHTGKRIMCDRPPFFRAKKPSLFCVLDNGHDGECEVEACPHCGASQVPKPKAAS